MPAAGWPPARSTDPVLRVAGEPFPRSLDASGAHVDPGQESGRYACLATSREVPAGRRAEASAIGHPYRLRIDFASGRYALCKVAGLPGDGSLGAQPRVTGAAGLRRPLSHRAESTAP